MMLFEIHIRAKCITGQEKTAHCFKTQTNQKCETRFMLQLCCISPLYYINETIFFLMALQVSFTTETWVQHHHINLRYRHLAVSWTSLLCDCKVSCPLVQCFSLWSCMSTECLISAGRDKCPVSMATTCTHVNMPAVCEDKAWCYVFLSCGLSATVTLGLHKCRKCTCIVLLDLVDELLAGHLTHPMTSSQRCQLTVGLCGLSLLSKILDGYL